MHGTEVPDRCCTSHLSTAPCTCAVWGRHPGRPAGGSSTVFRPLTASAPWHDPCEMPPQEVADDDSHRLSPSGFRDHARRPLRPAGAPGADRRAGRAGRADGAARGRVHDLRDAPRLRCLQSPATDTCLAPAPDAHLPRCLTAIPAERPTSLQATAAPRTACPAPRRPPLVGERRPFRGAPQVPWSRRACLPEGAAYPVYPTEVP